MCMGAKFMGGGLEMASFNVSIWLDHNAQICGQIIILVVFARVFLNEINI